MVNITISVPQDLYDKMKRHSEVDWSEVAEKALTDYVEQLELVNGRVVSSEKLAKMMKDANLDVSCIDLKKAVEYYEKSRKLECRRNTILRERSRTNHQDGR